MAGRNTPTKEEVDGYLKDTNWGRWGENGGAGALNLITNQKRLDAIGLVKKGRTVSLSRHYLYLQQGIIPDQLITTCTKKTVHLKAELPWTITGCSIMGQQQHI